MTDTFVNLWGNIWVRASEVVSVTLGTDPDGYGEDAKAAVFVRMRDGAVHSNVFEDESMNLEVFVQELVRQLEGEPDEGEG